MRNFAFNIRVLYFSLSLSLIHVGRRSQSAQEPMYHAPLEGTVCEISRHGRSLGRDSAGFRELLDQRAARLHPGAEVFAALVLRARPTKVDRIFAIINFFINAVM